MWSFLQEHCVMPVKWPSLQISSPLVIVWQFALLVGVRMSWNLYQNYTSLCLKIRPVFPFYFTKERLVLFWDRESSTLLPFAISCTDWKLRPRKLYCLCNWPLLSSIFFRHPCILLLLLARAWSSWRNCTSRSDQVYGEKWGLFDLLGKGVGLGMALLLESSNKPC